MQSRFRTRATFVALLLMDAVLRAVPGIAASASGGSAGGGLATGGSATGGSAVGGSAVGGNAFGGGAMTAPMRRGAVRGGPVSPIGRDGVASPGTATTSIGGRTIRAVADGGVTIHTEGRQVARVELGSHTLLVEPSRLLLDGSELTTLTRGADIEIRMTDDVLSIQSGGAELLSQRLGEP